MELPEHPDWALVVALGGAAKVVKLLNLGDGGIQRVQNWKTRGIPPGVKLERPDLFLPEMRPKGKRSAPVSEEPQKAG